MRKETKSDDKSRGPIIPIEALSKERKKGKSLARNNQETWVKGNQMKAPKMKWAKFKRQTQIDDIAKHERQPERFSWEVCFGLGWIGQWV